MSASGKCVREGQLPGGRFLEAPVEKWKYDEEDNIPQQKSLLVICIAATAECPSRPRTGCQSKTHQDLKQGWRLALLSRPSEGRDCRGWKESQRRSVNSTLTGNWFHPWPWKLLWCLLDEHFPYLPSVTVGRSCQDESLGYWQDSSQGRSQGR